MSGKNVSTNWYDYLFVELADPRTSSWFLLKDPFLLLSIIMAYLYFVTKLGPRIMKNREPFEMKKLLIVYNYLQILLSLWIFVEALEGAWLFKYSWKCQPIDYSYSPDGLRAARGVYIYFLAKITELLDTVFFVLRKKFEHITFLHLYHHAGMVAIAWGGAKYFPGGHFTFIGFVNSFIHIVMYTYYMVAACGPEYQTILWWKKYLTRMQLIQFCIVFLHSLQIIYYDCGIPKWTTLFISPNAVFFYYLFMDFYGKAYQEENRNDKVDSHTCTINDKMDGATSLLRKRKINSS